MRYGVVLAFLLLASCGGGDDAAHADGGDAHADSGAAPAHGADDTAAHAHEGDSASAQPLLPIMRRLALDMAALQQALWLDDLPAVERHAAAIAQHPNIAPAELRRIEQTLGAETAVFDSIDLAVHEHSVALHEAAQRADAEALLDRLSDVQRGCVACHARFRERLRTSTGTSEGS